MKRTFITTLKLSSIALACALSLSASISGAAGESFDTSNGWYGRAGGPVAPASLAIFPEAAQRARRSRLEHHQP